MAITESLKNLGFSADNIIEEQYYTNAYDPSYGEDSTAYTIATKPLSTGEEIVTIVVRGSYGEFDLFDYSKWANDWKGNTNFKNYDRGLHEGFSIAADKIYERLESFLSEKSINKNNVKFVITGHSRGAAVANLVSKKLIDKGIPTNKVYDYNFACPDSGRDYDGEWNRDNKYGGMFNINNVKDIIGVIPGALFLSTLNTTSFFTGFFDRLLSFNFNYDVLFWGKYGTTYFFSNEWTALTDTVFGDPNVEHHPTTYLNYLSDKPSNSSFKSWLEARAIFTSNVTGITELGKVLGIHDGEVIGEKDGAEVSFPCDYAVMAVGSKKRDGSALAAACYENGIAYFEIGDAAGARRALNATREGFDAALKFDDPQEHAYALRPKKVVFVTGATGTMGQETMKQLLSRSNRFVTRILARPSAKNKELLKKYRCPALEIVWGDMTDYDTIKKCVDGADYVLHIGAMVSPAADAYPEKTLYTNIGSTLNIIKAIKEQPDSDKVHFAYVGTVAMTGSRLEPVHFGRVGDPMFPSIHDYYALSKVFRNQPFQLIKESVV